MNVAFFPRSQVMDAFIKGWRLIPAHPYQAGDYAVLLYKPEKRTKVTRNLMEAWASGLDKPRRETLGNRTWGARSFREGVRATAFASTAGA